MERRADMRRHTLVCLQSIIKEDDLSVYAHLKENFCGRVVDCNAESADTIELVAPDARSVVYACGDIQRLRDRVNPLPERVQVVREFSYNHIPDERFQSVSLGEVPINVHEAAVYYRNCLSPEAQDKYYFELLQNKHKFQALTESNKPGTSFRKGAYLCEVETNGDASKFHLLRCSTNLSGPTLAFADEDRKILSTVNELARRHFDPAVNLNHVLAQVYENSVTTNEWNKAKEHKAKIKSHSDKTKDMPANGVIAFCTFYSSDIGSYETSHEDRFDRRYSNKSVLTQLRFRLKDSASHLLLSKDFRVSLYPNSVLFIPLSTNRLYTHEILPPSLSVGKFPTRLGYVVRCSKTRAVFREGGTFIERNGQENVPLRKPTDQEQDDLRRLYREENISAQEMFYPDIWFSMNGGDFKRPLMS